MENCICISAMIGDEYSGYGPAMNYRWVSDSEVKKSDEVYVRTPYGETTAIVCDVYLTNPIEAKRLPTARAFA